jgi:Secretion system C-terminal sorting domain
MKKVFSLLVVFSFLHFSVFAATRYWVGVPNGLWSATTSWSATSGGASGASTPGSLDDVIFDGTASASIDVAPTINSLTIQGTSSVVDFTSTTGRKFWINHSGFLGLTVASGCTLNYGVHSNSGANVLELNAYGEVSGTLNFNGSTSAVTPGMNISATQKLSIKANGKLVQGVNSKLFTTSAFRPNGYLFEANSTFRSERTSTTFVEGVYDPNSTVEIVGFTTGGAFLYGGVPNVEIGNLIWNCPNQTGSANLTIATAYNIKGKVKIINTGATPKDFRFCSNTASTLTIKDSLIVGVNTLFSLTGGTGAGTVKLEKHLINNGTITESGGATTSSIQFVGTSVQNYIGTGTVMSDVDMLVNNGTGGSVNLINNLSLPKNLTFTNGVITLGNNTLTVNKTSNILTPSSNSYAVTNGTGKLRIANTDAQTSLTFPIGNMVGSYTPLTVANSGTADGFSASVSNNVSGTYADRTKAIQREWDLSEDVAGGSNAILTFQFNTAELGGAMATTGIMEVGHYNGASWDVTPGSISGAGPYMITHSTGFTSFSPFTAGSAQSLPIELLSFEGALNKKKVVLTWQTASEKNNDFFTIERSADNENFVAIGKVAGARQSDVVRAYQYLDVAPLKGINYYRLTQTDLDGHTNTLKTISIENGNTQMTIASLNSGAGQLHLGIQTAQAARTNIQVIDMNGRVLYATSEELNEGTTELSIQQAFSAGIYMVRLSNELGETVSKMLLVK